MMHLFFLISRYMTLLLPLMFQIPNPNWSGSPTFRPHCDLCAEFSAVTFLPLSAASDVRWTVVPGGRRYILQNQTGPSPGWHRVWGRQGNPASHCPQQATPYPLHIGTSSERWSALHSGAPEAPPGHPRNSMEPT